jgi:hypothetical protein
MISKTIINVLKHDPLRVWRLLRLSWVREAWADPLRADSWTCMPDTTAGTSPKEKLPEGQKSLDAAFKNWDPKTRAWNPNEGETQQY